MLVIYQRPGKVKICYYQVPEPQRSICFYLRCFEHQKYYTVSLTPRTLQIIRLV